MKFSSLLLTSLLTIVSAAPSSGDMAFDTIQAGIKKSHDCYLKCYHDGTVVTKSDENAKDSSCKLECGYESAWEKMMAYQAKHSGSSQ